MVRISQFVLCFIVLAGTAGRIHAMGTEKHGNAPLPEGFLTGKEATDLANLDSRVYWREVNGDVRLFYHGDTAALNEALRLLAKAPGEARELILLPGPGGSVEGLPRKPPVIALSCAPKPCSVSSWVNGPNRGSMQALFGGRALLV